MTKIAILGGGGWGTALSVALSRSRHAHEIALWVRQAELAESILATRENKTYLPAVEIPARIVISSDPAAILNHAQIIIVAVPAAFAREILILALPHISPEAIIVSAAKGLEPATHLRISQVIEQVCSQRFVPQIAALSGPSFALEVARGEPTTVVIASEGHLQKFGLNMRSGAPLTEYIQEQFSGPSFRLHTSDDVLGVELAGAMKNVMAVAAGACQGIGLGANALAGIITRSFSEMVRLGLRAGAKLDTLSGLAGVGDLVLTCNGSQSCNRHVGFELGKGRALAEILGEMSSVAEGVGTAPALLALAGELHVEMPITEQVNAILKGWKSPAEAIRDVLERPLKPE